MKLGFFPKQEEKEELVRESFQLLSQDILEMR
jgi:hypothetical protein